MLPKEVGNLFAAVTNSTDSTLDAQRLGFELAGLASFHQELFDSQLLSPQQIDLLQTWRTGTRHDLGLTAPPEGPPEIQLKITAPKGGVPPVGEATSRLIVCPHCHEPFALKL